MEETCISEHLKCKGPYIGCTRKNSSFKEFLRSQCMFMVKSHSYIQLSFFIVLSMVKQINHCTKWLGNSASLPPIIEFITKLGQTKTFSWEPWTFDMFFEGLHYLTTGQVVVTTTGEWGREKPLDIHCCCSPYQTDAAHSPRVSHVKNSTSASFTYKSSCGAILHMSNLTWVQ